MTGLRGIKRIFFRQPPVGTTFTHPYRSSIRAKLASGEGELSDGVSEIADAPVSFVLRSQHVGNLEIPTSNLGGKKTLLLSCSILFAEKLRWKFCGHSYPT